MQRCRRPGWTCRLLSRYPCLTFHCRRRIRGGHGAITSFPGHVRSGAAASWRCRGEEDDGSPLDGGAGSAVGGEECAAAQAPTCRPPPPHPTAPDATWLRLSASARTFRIWATGGDLSEKVIREGTHHHAVMILSDGEGEHRHRKPRWIALSAAMRRSPWARDTSQRLRHVEPWR